MAFKVAGVDEGVVAVLSAQGVRIGAGDAAARVSTSMRIAMNDLKLDSLYVVYPGAHRYKLADRMEAVPLWAMLPGEPAAH